MPPTAASKSPSGGNHAQRHAASGSGTAPGAKFGSERFKRLVPVGNPLANSFTFDGQTVPYRPGDTFASALHRSGVRVLSRSLKYHRPRGLYCNMGSCASCFVDVDGNPNVPACMAQAQDGAALRSQNRLGSAKHDLLGLVDKVYRDSFDPHDAFTKPKIVNDAFLMGVRFMSGLGRPPTPQQAPRPATRHQLHVAELIVGGGFGGLQRARKAASTLPERTDATPSILLVEEMPQLGGTATWDPLEIETRRMAAEATTWPGVAAWTETLCFGLYQEGLRLRAGLRRVVPGGEELWEVTADRITLATGSHDGHPEFPNNDLPGVMALRGALRLLGEHQVLPGRRIVVHGTPLRAPDKARLENAGAVVVAQGQVTAAKGTIQVDAVQMAGSTEWRACDTILCHEPLHPRVELYQQAGARLTWRNDRMVPAVDAANATSVAGLFAADNHVARLDLGGTSPLAILGGDA